MTSTEPNPTVETEGRTRRRVRAPDGAARRPTLIDYAFLPFLIVAFLISGGAFLMQLSGIDPAAPVKSQDISSATSQLATGGSFLIMIGYGLLDWRGFGRLIAKCWPLFLMPAMALVSTAWSPEPNTTLRRSIALIAAIFGVIGLVNRFPAYRALQLLVQIMASAVTLSLAYVGLNPKFGVHQHNDAMQNVHVGQWRGIFSHRTGLGRISGLSAPVLYYAGLPAVRNQYVAWGLMGVAAVCLLMAKSGGGFISAAILMSLPLLLLQYQKLPSDIRPFVSVGAVLIMIAAAFVIEEGIPLVLAVLGKDATFTGRTPLWAFILQEVRQSPWIGFSYSAGWIDKLGPDLRNKTIYGLVPNAQNGYLDTMVSVGYIGLALALTPVAIASFRAVRLALSPAPKYNSLALVPVMVMLFYIESNIVEAWLFAPNSIATQCFLFVFAALARNDLAIAPTEIRRRRRRAPSAPESGPTPPPSQPVLELS